MKEKSHLLLEGILDYLVKSKVICNVGEEAQLGLQEQCVGYITS